MEVKWGLICTLADNKPDGLVITRPFHDGTAPSFPFAPPRFYHVASITGNDGETHLLGSRIIAPSGDVVLLDQGERITIEGGWCAFIRGYQDVVFPDPGNYLVDILVDGKPIHSITLTLKQK